jgi:hypothetical protein
MPGLRRTRRAQLCRPYATPSRSTELPRHPVSNVPFDANARAEDQFPTLWDVSRLPPDLVAVMLGNEPEYIPCDGSTGTSMPYSAAEATDSSHWADDLGWQDAGSL